MTDFPIPVRIVGAGSQPAEEDALQFLPMPREMNTFRMPTVPDGAAREPMTEARDALAGLSIALERWNPEADAHGPELDLAGVTPAALEILNQVLGEGEVSIRIGGERAARIQESVFTGLWRVCVLDSDGGRASDRLEAAPLPHIVVEAARAGATAHLAPVELPAGAMNSPAVIAEIGAQMRAHRPGDRAHVINLTLFPMTPDDHAVLEAVLPVGPVALISRGFGNCRITSTLARDVWRVQYFNNMNTLILNTIEVVEMPEVALAAAEDLADTRTRLSDLVDWMSESCPT